MYRGPGWCSEVQWWWIICSISMLQWVNQQWLWGAVCCVSLPMIDDMSNALCRYAYDGWCIMLWVSKEHDVMMIGSSIDDGYNIESTRREAYQACQGKQCLPSIDRRFSYKSAGIQMSSRKDLKVRPTTFIKNHFFTYNNNVWSVVHTTGPKTRFDREL